MYAMMKTNAVMKTYPSRTEWLMARKTFIGGSDAACIVGANPWKDNVTLWDEKKGILKPEDVDNPLVEYGRTAESHLRDLFAIDYPKMSVFYAENNMWTNDRYPWAHASLDGWMMDEDGRLGILEIKTATISGARQKFKWSNGQIPQNYYIQILHYFIVTEFEFAILKAQLKYEIPGEELFIKTHHYRIEREEAEDDIKYLIEKEKEFADSLRLNRRPSLILPEI